MRTLASKVATSLRKTLGRKIDILDRPFTPLPLGGLRPTVFVAAVSFFDQSEIAADGVRVNRKPLNEGTIPGYVEERLGRVAVRIDCVALSNSAVQDLCLTIAPAAFLTLTSMTSLSLGEASNGLCALEFRHFSVSCHSLTFGVEADKDRPYSRGTLEFHLNGFLHVSLRSKRMRTPSKRKHKQ